MPVYLDILGNEAKSSVVDYNSYIIPVSSEVEGIANNYTLVSFKSAGSKFLPLSGGSITGQLNLYGAISGINNSSISLNSGLAFGNNSFAVGRTAATGNYSTGFGNNNWAGGECFVAGFNTIAGGFQEVDNSIPAPALKIAPNIWNVSLRNGFTAGTPSYVLMTGYSDALPAPGTFTKSICKVNSVLGTALNISVVDVLGTSDPNIWSVLTSVSIYADNYTDLPGRGAVALGFYSTALGDGSFASGFNTLARGNRAVALGSYTQSLSEQAVALGLNSIASGLNSVAMGFNTTASAAQSFSHGNNNASGNLNSVAFGFNNKSLGEQSFVGGQRSLALGNESFSYGISNTARGVASFAQGAYTETLGQESQALGYKATAAHNYSFIWSDGNLGTLSNNISTTNTGQFVVSASNGMFVPGKLGIGTSDLSGPNLLNIKGVAYSDTLSSNEIFTNAYKETDKIYVNISSTGFVNLDTNWDGKVVLINNASPLEITAIPGVRKGFSVTFIAMTNDDVTFAPGVGVNLNSDSNKRKISTRYCSVVLNCYDTDSYLLLGSITT